jgi:hypothetical protein
MKREQVKGHPGIRRRTWMEAGRTEIRYDAAYRGPDGRIQTRTCGVPEMQRIVAAEFRPVPIGFRTSSS